MPLNITIDGPVGAGKSSVADAIAKKLSILHLDTGAMYRAFAYYCVKKGISVEDEAAVAEIIDDVEISVEFCDGKQKTLLNGVAVDDFIRTPEISMAASTVSKMGIVREKLVNEQRKIAKTRDMILEGRDIGTNVLTDAEVKIF
ncbi:MAG: (d)CMP kinase, partial [Christensenellaceae bacterium]|nr:(d)CMP kinase [Christensenellaceae bacterium]